MFDIDIVRANYASMREEKLAYIALTEGTELTDEALLALKEEYSKRGMDMSIFSTIAAAKEKKQEIPLIIPAEEITKKFDNLIWEYAYDEKIHARSNEEITSGLLERGLNEDEAGAVVKNIGNNATLLLQKSNKQMERFGMISGIGISAIIMILLLSKQRGSVYFLAWVVVLFGGIRFFIALATRTKCRSILKNIDPEKTGPS